MGFYESYIEMINSPTELTCTELYDKKFRQLLVEEHGQNIATIKLLASAVKRTLNKPQQLLHEDDDYYVAIDMYTNTYYVCYKHLLMIDIDFYKGQNNELTDIDRQIAAIIQKFGDFCDINPELKFKLYRSRNGIHAFLISDFADYKHNKYIQLMLDLDTDFYYIVYSYLRGWSVRLNKKKSDIDDKLYTYIGDIGGGKTINQLEKLVNLHINLVDVFKNVKANSMYGG